MKQKNKEATECKLEPINTSFQYCTTAFQYRSKPDSRGTISSTGQYNRACTRGPASDSGVKIPQPVSGPLHNEFVPLVSGQLHLAIHDALGRTALTSQIPINKN